MNKRVMVNVFTLFILALSLSGCVKLQILPEDAVENSIKAGKNLYDEVKLKNKGGEKREFSSQVAVSAYSSRDDAEQNCIASLKAKLNSESVKQNPVVISEKIIVIDGVTDNIIECQLVGFVWTT